jgi:hypothetical protein
MRHHLGSEPAYWLALTDALRDRWRRARQSADKGGMSAEAVIIIAALTLVAVTAMGIITAKIIQKANGISF